MQTQTDAAKQREMIAAAAERGARAVTTRETLRKYVDWVVEALHLKLPRYNWTGIYLLRGDELVLECYRGAPSPHSRIPLGRGICGAAVMEQQTILVPDVAADPRYLACSLETRSEIVVPIRAGGEIVGEIDVDSNTPAAFSADDQNFLETLAGHIGSAIERTGGIPEEKQI
jgi:GAF domain-containing protein